MFSKIKHLKDLRNQAKTMQNALAEEVITVERSGIKLTIDGNQEVRSLTFERELPKDELERELPKLINEANEKIKRIMAQKMQSMAGFDAFKF